MATQGNTAPAPRYEPFSSKDEQWHIAMERLQLQRASKVQDWALYVKAHLPIDRSLCTTVRNYLGYEDFKEYVIGLSEEEALKIIGVVARNGANRIEEKYGDVKLLDGLARDACLQLVMPECIRLLGALRPTGLCCCVQYAGEYARLRETPKETQAPTGDGSASPEDGGVIASGMRAVENFIYGETTTQTSVTPGEALHQDVPNGLNEGGSGNTVDEVIAHVIGEGESRVVPVTEDISVAFGMVDEGTEQVRGIVVSSATIAVRLPANTQANALAAIKKRTEKVPDQVKIPQPVHLGLVAIARWLKSEVFTVEAFQDFMAKHSGYDDMCSKKWTHARFHNALANLISHSGDPYFTQFYPGIRQDAMMKNEVAAAGKAFRVVINHGDEGQLLGLLVNGFIEDAFFTRFLSQSIKKADKVTAMGRVANTLRQEVPCTTVELDGSAWDWCCNSRVRQFENELYTHAACVANGCTAVMSMNTAGWHDRYLSFMAKEHTELRLPKGAWKKHVFKAMSQVRDSGDRGTSVKNGLINFGLTVATLAHPDDAVKVFTTGTGRMQDGKTGTLRNAHEGDDTALTISPRQSADSKLLLKQQENWKQCGFAMKIKVLQPGEVAEFCGWKLMVGINGPTSVMGPDLPRNLKKLNVLTSPAALATYNKQTATIDVEKLRGIHSSKLVALAVNCAPHFPAVSMAMLARIANGPAAILDDDFRYKVDPTADYTAFKAAGMPMVVAADTVNSRLVDRPDQFENMAALFGGTAAEWTLACHSL